MPITTFGPPNRLTTQDPDYKGDGPDQKWKVATLPAPYDVSKRGGGYTMEAAPDGSGNIDVFFIPGADAEAFAYQINQPDNAGNNGSRATTTDAGVRRRLSTNAKISRINTANARFWNK